jgi:ABC-type multidrug transport system permease subunit
VQKHATQSSSQYSPLAQLVLARLREFYREPEAVFWVYGFPIVMIVLLGIAFRNKPIEKVNVDIVSADEAKAKQVIGVLEKGEPGKTYVVTLNDLAAAQSRRLTGKTDLIVQIGGAESAGQKEREKNSPAYGYIYDPGRPESVLARDSVNNLLQRAAGRTDPLAVANHPVDEPGGRYIDFLVPGLLGMSLMGGGLWGVGFVTVDMRIRKLLKRFLATPMKKSHFLAGIMISRLLFIIPEVLVLLVFAWLSFGVMVHGSVALVVLLILIGAFTFAGIGLLVASRAKTLETVSGLMNLVMLPMWLLSGIFFPPERFPDFAQPFIRILPLTPLISSLRAVMQEGSGLLAVAPQVGILLAWGVVTFVLALRWFRWM